VETRQPLEFDVVARIVDELTRPGVTWTRSQGEAEPLETRHILVVAPYNARVGALIDRLPRDVHTGTVDRVQSHEAPVVIYSMASSSAEEAPCGMGFLYSPNRLNVATSRARCACILVAALRLTEPDCRTPEQMRWANGLCMVREMAREVTV